MTAAAFLMTGGGLALLFFGGEFLLRGAVAVALRSGLSPLLIGLTIVACATSMPELLVTVTAGLKGVTDVGIGNVIGSNSQLNGGVSVLDSTTRAAESDASANGLSGPSLNSPILSAPAAIGAINSGTTNTRLFQSINPFRSLNATAQTPANQALSGNRLFAWLRNFPLFSLNQSTISTEAPINAWQERLRSFYQAPSASLQDSALGAGERRGLFSALMPNSSASQPVIRSSIKGLPRPTLLRTAAPPLRQPDHC